MSARIEHTIADGFCTVCGDTAEWLQDNLRTGDTITLIGAA